MHKHREEKSYTNVVAASARLLHEGENTEPRVQRDEIPWQCFDIEQHFILESMRKIELSGLVLEQALCEE